MATGVCEGAQADNSTTVIVMSSIFFMVSPFIKYSVKDEFIHKLIDKYKNAPKGLQSGQRDSNPRISAWKADALPLGDARIVPKL